MSFTLLTNVISPHQLPLAQEIIKHIGEENYRYIYTDELESQRQEMGWQGQCSQNWCIKGNESSPGLLASDMLFSELRAMEVFDKRLSNNKLTCYVSERWFKPPHGFLRMLSPSYQRMARRFAEYLTSKHFHYFPQGIHAARDMMRIQGLFHGDFRCLFHAPKVAFESRPGGRIIPLDQAIAENLLSTQEIEWGRKHGFIRIPPEHWKDIKEPGPWPNYHLWGYFVAPGNTTQNSPASTPARKILWVGRMLDWKRVGTLIQALPDSMELDLYGHGPDEANLRSLASAKANVHFHDFLPIEQVRALMHNHDLYVLPSDGGEGWGAVLNEALEEGMAVLASLESGSGATILPPELLFHAGNAKELREKLIASIPRLGIGEWSVSKAADYLMGFCKTNID